MRESEQVLMEKPLKKATDFAKKCPFGNEHEWAVAATFLGEAELFQIDAEPREIVCRKCWTRLQDAIG